MRAYIDTAMNRIRAAADGGVYETPPGKFNKRNTAKEIKDPIFSDDEEQD